MQLPVLDNRRTAANGRRAGFVHALRMALLAILLVGLHVLAARKSASGDRAVGQLPLATIRTFFPNAHQLRSESSEDNLALVLDESGAPLGAVAQTSPQADEIVGYAGPSNVVLLMDEQTRLRQAHLLSSRDTAEHVRQVANADAFWNQFVGWRWGAPPAHKVDGVSGATLTSLAIAESIILRMSGARQSLRFADVIGLEEVQQIHPGARRLERDPRRDDWMQVFDDRGNILGSVIRTGPLVDSIEGYQGPSELLLFVDARSIAHRIRLRRSFDNEPYVGYVKREASFWSTFQGKTLAEMAEMDLNKLGVEGVSGATMTSMAVARTLNEACQRLAREGQPKDATVSSRGPAGWNWSWSEIVTSVLSVAAIGWTFSRWRGRRGVRFVWQLASLVVLGIATGNLLSLALVAGWTRGGVPYRFAPGLLTLLVVAYVWPAIAKRNVYCDHLCPHGTLQQWLSRAKHHSRFATWSTAFRMPTRAAIPASAWPWIARGMSIYAYGCVCLALGWLALGWPVNLAWFEPFDTYAWRVGLSGSLAIWLLSLFVAIRKPMAYCRFACATGKTLQYVRYSAARGRISQLDMALVLVTGAVWAILAIS